MMLLAGVVALVRVAFFVIRSRDGRTTSSPIPPADDPRWLRAPIEERIVGAPCVHCGVRFVIAEEARNCKVCDELVHRRVCGKEHRMKEHAKKSDVPYR